MTQPPGDPTTPAQPTPPGDPTAPAQPTPPGPPTQPFPPIQPPQVYLPSQPAPQYQPYPPQFAYFPQPGQPGYAQPEPPKKRRGLLIGILAAVFVLFLAGGGISAYTLLTRDTVRGQTSPTAAVDGFLTAIYTNHDATAAAKYVCPQARDRAKLAAKIDEIRKRDSQYELPTYRWTGPVLQKDFHGPADEAEVATILTVRTSTEQHAEQPLLFVATRHNGWWVCEVKQGA